MASEKESYRRVEDANILLIQSLAEFVKRLTGIIEVQQKRIEELEKK